MRENFGPRPIEKSYVAIGWSELGDLRKYPNKEALKKRLRNISPIKIRIQVS